MPKPKLWRVRVRKSVEDWVSVSADTPLQAETLVATMPFILSVFNGMTMRGDRPVDQAIPVGVLEEDEDE
jgi:hypothetical protein